MKRSHAATAAKEEAASAQRPDTALAGADERHYEKDAWDKYTMTPRYVRELQDLTGDDKLLYGFLAHVETFQRSFTVDELAEKIGTNRKTVMRSIVRLRDAHMLAAPSRDGRRQAYTYLTTPDDPNFGRRARVDGRDLANQELSVRAQEAREIARKREADPSPTLFESSQIGTTRKSPTRSQSGTASNPKLGLQTDKKGLLSSPKLGPRQSQSGTTTVNIEEKKTDNTSETPDDDGFDNARRTQLVAMGCDSHVVDEHYARLLTAIAAKRGTNALESRQLLDEFFHHPLVVKASNPYGALYVGICGRGRTPAYLLDEPGEAEWRQVVPGIQSELMRALDEERLGSRVDWSKLERVLEVTPEVIEYARLQYARRTGSAGGPASPS